MNKSKTEKNEISQEKKKSGTALTFFKKLLFRLAIPALSALALYFGAKYSFAKFTQVQISKKRAMVERELSECAELVLYKMRYSDLITMKKRRAMSTAYSFIRYSGIIRAGIDDVSKIRTEISADGKSIEVRLPRAKVLGNEISSQEIFDEKQGIFAKISTQEVFDEIAIAKEEAANEILSEGFLKDADERAAYVIRQMLLPVGFENIVIRTE